MKGSIKKAITVVLAILCIPTFPAYAEEAITLDNVTFENMYLGVPPSGFNVGESGNKIQVVELEKGYNGESQRVVAMEMTDDLTAGENCSMQRGVAIADCKNFVYEWWWYPGDTTTNKTVYLRDTATRTEAIFMSLNDKGNIVVTSDNNRVISDYIADKWYHVRAIFDYAESDCDIYINDELKAQNCASPVTGMPDAIKFGKSYSAKRMGITYVDNFRAYTGNELLGEDKFVVPERDRGYAPKKSLADGEVYLSETFEEQFAETTHAGYYNVRYGNMSKLVEHEGGNVITVYPLENPDAKQIYFEKYGFSDVLEGQLIFEFKIKPMETTSRAVGLLRSVTGTQHTIADFNKGKMKIGVTEVGRYEAGRWYNILCKIDIDNKTISYYLDGEQIGATNQSFMLGNLNTYRFYHEYETDLLYYYDDFRIYGGTEIITDFPPRDISYDYNPVEDERLNDTISLFIGNEHTYVNGEKKLVDADNENVKPFVSEGRTMVPLRFIAENFGADVSWNEETATAIVKRFNKVLEMTHGNKKAKYLKKDYELYAAPIIKEGRIFVPLRDVAQMFEKDIFYNDMGLIVLGDNVSTFDTKKDIDLIENLIGAIIYDRPSGEKIYQDFKKSGVGHPRVLITQSQLDFLKEVYTTDVDPLGKKYIEDVIASAEFFMGREMPAYGENDSNLKSTIRNRCATLSLARILTGEKKYADELWRITQIFCEYPDWFKTNGLNIGEMLAGVAICYDWNYDYWTEEQRQYIRDAVKRNAFKDIKRTYEQSAMKISTWVDRENNFNSIGTAGVMAISLAFIDDEELGEDAKWCAEKALLGFENLMKVCMPDGAWKEGLVYWSYTMRFAAPFIAMLKNVCGDDYGILDCPGFLNSGNFFIYMQGPTGIFNFADADAANAGIRSALELFSFTDFTGDETYAKRNVYYKILANETGAWLDLLSYRPVDLETIDQIDRPLDGYFKGYNTLTIAAFRNSWKQDANFIAFVGGGVGYEHSEFDVGTFVIDALGERWAYDLGPDSYSLSEYNSQYQEFKHYRRRTEGHNSIVLNPSFHAGQDLGSRGYAPIDIRYMNEEDGASAVLDMTSLYYGSGGLSVKRGIKLCDNRSRFIIRDEIRKQPGDIYWFMHTDAEILLADNNRSASLRKNGKEVRVTVLEDDVEFGVMDAVPLPTSPISLYQNKNEGFRKLFIRSENVTEAIYTVVIDPITDEHKQLVMPVVEPLDKW